MGFGGQTAVVVGGATGIGSGLVRALAAAGAAVHLCDIDEAGAASLAAACAPGPVTVHRADVTDHGGLEATAREIAAAGPLALVFVNAGGIVLRPFLESTAQDWDWLIGLNFLGTVNAIRAFLPALLAQGAPARLVVTSSVAALRAPAMPGQTLYVASKAAQLGLCSALSTELAGSNVALSVVLPGPVHSDIRAKSEKRRPGSIAVAVPASIGASGYLTPDEAAARILAGVAAGQPFITTHPGQRDRVREAQDDILAAFTA